MASSEVYGDATTGAYYEVATVSNLWEDTEEEETYIGNTHDGWESDFDYEEFDVNPSSKGITFAGSLHAAIELEFSTFYSPGFDQLEDGGLTEDTENGTQINPVSDHEALRVYVFDQDPSQFDSAEEGAVDVITYPNVELRLDNMEFGDDSAGELPFHAKVREFPVVESESGSE